MLLRKNIQYTKKEIRVFGVLKETPISVTASKCFFLYTIKGATYMKDETKDKLDTVIDLVANASGDVLSILSDSC